jgi:hypothetical protein
VLTGAGTSTDLTNLSAGNLQRLAQACVRPVNA